MHIWGMPKPVSRRPEKKPRKPLPQLGTCAAKALEGLEPARGPRLREFPHLGHCSSAGASSHCSAWRKNCRGVKTSLLVDAEVRCATAGCAAVPHEHYHLQLTTCQHSNILLQKSDPMSSGPHLRDDHRALDAGGEGLDDVGCIVADAI